MNGFSPIATLQKSLLARPRGRVLMTLASLLMGIPQAQAKITEVQPIAHSLNSILFVAAFQAYPVLESQTQIQPTGNPTQPGYQAMAPQLLSQGTQISLNGRLWPIAWRQWQGANASETRMGVSDLDLMQQWGVDLLNSRDHRFQPVSWFSPAVSLPAMLVNQTRFLDVTNLFRGLGWETQVQGDVLQITSPIAQVLNLRQSHRGDGQRVVIDLNRPVPWQITQEASSVLITLNAIVDPALLTPPSSSLPAPASQSPTPLPQVETRENQVLIRIPASSSGLRVTTLPDPFRLVIDLGTPPPRSRDITWAPGIRWQERTIQVGDRRFSVIGLAVDLKRRNLSLRPITSDPAIPVGTAPLRTIAQNWQVISAINGGYFNRNNRLPLGAVRQDQRWRSGPILNRGAVAWNGQGEFRMGRLSLQETLVTEGGKRLPIVALNSGYVQAGIGRYTPGWGTSYTPILENEVLVSVAANRVTAVLKGGPAGQDSFPIPPNGYLLALRANRTALEALPIGAIVQLESSISPPEFASFPHILGAGPLLMKDRQVVLDAKSEKFSEAFIREAAVRSAIGQMGDGSIFLATVMAGPTGDVPTLSEVAQVMKQWGAIDALNLDGGSSTALYLGGTLINRSAQTAARVHNGLGLFLEGQP
ncbi:MAG: phosphodiester glycosidase family protein [Leptolyngbyaceae cyanobacterium bins.59]|nr:phosphodiester glycosidase family protein [Leptolyngbyaceae cyanobacterium bins.59]